MARRRKREPEQQGRPGRVVEIRGRRVRVRDDEGDRVCFLSGQRAVIGDRVRWVEAQGEGGKLVGVEKRETAENGESVVAMINGERVTLKRFYVEADGIRLQPATPAMEPIYLRHEELQILGIVVGVIRQI